MNVVFMIDIQNDDRSKNTPYKLSQEVWKAWIEDKPDTELFVLNEPLFELNAPESKYSCPLKPF